MGEKLREEQKAVRIDYVEPATEVARALQYPMTDQSWPMRVVNAYVKDVKRARIDARAALEASNV